MTRKKTPPSERFWKHVRENGNGCWIWTAYIAPNGYGQFSKEHGRVVYAHRFAYEDMVGEIPEGLDLDHLCRNRACVNPYHLDPVTRAVNMRRAPVNQVTHCPAGHAYAGRNLYVDTNGRRRCRQCRNDNLRAWKQRKSITNTPNHQGAHHVSL